MPPGRLAHLRARATGFGWRAARATARRARAVGRRGPEISVVVPFYNVEAYLAECLDSLVDQTFDDFEVLLVDDGSPDGSRAIAERYAAADPRLRVVTRPNGGLGAARNTGIREARGRYLTFVDSDDVVPRHALGLLRDSAEATGSDIVVGAVERFDSTKSWPPQWVDDVHHLRRERIRVEDFLPLLRNLYTWNKLYRRDFWTAQGLWFREGVAYEDQPIVTQLLARARSIDVLPDTVYRYRLRDDRSSISQQTASVKDLRDRIAAWEASVEAFRADGVPARVQEGWLQTLFEAHFQWYLTSPGTVDDTYWAELEAAVRRHATGAPAWVWEATSPAQRVLVALTLAGRRADVQELVRRNGTKLEQWPARVRDDGILVELPFLGDPDLDEELFLVRPEQVRLTHAVENLHWVDRPGGTAAWLSGWAYLRKVDLARHEQRVEVQLRNDDSGEVRRFPATECPTASTPAPVDDLWCDHAPGRFGVEIPLEELVPGRDDDVWTVWLRVEAGGLVAEHPVNRLVRSGAAGAIPAVALGGGTRLLADWAFQRPLQLRLDRDAVVARTLELDGRTLRGTFDAEHAGGVSRVTVEADGGVRATASWHTAPDGTRGWSVALPELPEPAPGECVTWIPRGWSARGLPLDVLPAPGALPAPGGGARVLQTDRNGKVVVTGWVRGAAGDEVSVSDDGVLHVSGRLLGTPAPRVRLRTVNKRMQVTGEPADVDERGRFTATLELRHERFRFGRLPLVMGDHDVRVVAEEDDRSAAGAAAPLLVSADLGASLPLPLRSAELEGRVVRGPAGGLRLHVHRPLGSSRGAYQQNRLRRQVRPASSLTRGVLFRSYFGEQATDHGVAIHAELRRRGSDLPVYWAVQDRSVPVPEGGIPVVVNTPEFYDLISSASYYVDNMYQPEWHQKPAGQVLVQTFHGYPFKQMGHPHWENLQFSRAQIDSYDRRAAAWDHLVSPARYATPLLTRDFRYGGDVLEIGYPRNDVLLSDRADDLRREVRASLGIEEGQTAVLYAPTFRDYLATKDFKAAMADLLDVEGLIRALGEQYVLLVRGHAFNARADVRLGRLPGCREVTDYPEVSDLHLAADAAVVDYSSLRFDFGVTGKPMVFHVPDLERYHETRGWLLDYELTAPGPLVTTTEEVADALRDLPGLRTRHAAAYDAFRRDFLDLEDGRAAARLVDAVFAPRGDA